MGSKVLDQIKISAAEIDERLRSFSVSAQVFSCNRQALIDQYENKWIAVYRGQVEAVADSLEGVTREIEAKGIPPGETVVRHVDREEKTFIL